MRAFVIGLANLVGLLAVSGATANAVLHLPLLVSMKGAGTIHLSNGVSRHCTSSCPAGPALAVPSKVTLTATPAAGWELGAWHGACSGFALKCSLRLTHHSSVAVVFKRKVPAVLGTRALPVTQFPAYGDSIAVGPDGNLWFTAPGGVTQADGLTQPDQIGRITPAGVVTQFAIPTLRSDPIDITAGPDGNLWFTEYGGNKIGRITPDGTITEFAVPTANGGPSGIIAGPDGDIWFTELGNNPGPMYPGYTDPTVHKIGRITPTGTITEFSLPSAGVDPQAITTGPDGNLWFTGGHVIGRITPTGTISEFTVPGSTSNAYAITVGPDGNLWFTDHDAYKIGRITPTGTISEFPTGTGGSPYGIVAGADGNLWFSMPNQHELGRITPNGTITRFAMSSPPSPSQFGLAAGPNRTLWFPLGRAIGKINLTTG